MNLLGGRDAFNAKLDTFFSTPYQPKGICRDCTGVIGQYVQGNQPDQQAAYLYAWSGQPWKTQALTRRILADLYGSDATGYGYPGMDDQGSTSSWYVLSAMGFYPGRSIPPRVHHRQPDLRSRSPAPGQRQGVRDRRAQQLSTEHVHPVRHARRQAMEQTLVQPRATSRTAPRWYSRWGRSRARPGAPIRTTHRRPCPQAARPARRRHPCRNRRPRGAERRRPWRRHGQRRFRPTTPCPSILVRNWRARRWNIRVG